MRTKSLCLSLFASCFILLTSCSKDKANPTQVDSFLPMQIGNYWGTANRQNTFTEIQDTLKINNKLFYKFFSLVGGDVVVTSYMRIDEQNRLVQAEPKYPFRIYVKADFGANVSDIFYTLGDQTVNDYKVKVASKTDSEMSFDFDMIYHPNLKGQIRTDKYIKGKGWGENFEKVIINGVTYAR